MCYVINGSFLTPLLCKSMLCYHTVSVRRRRMCTFLLLVRAPQAETNGCRYTEVACTSQTDTSFRVHLQAERLCCVRSPVGLAAPPAAEWQVCLGSDVRGTHCTVEKTQATGVDFHFALAQNHGEARRPDVLLRLSCGIQRNACSVLRWTYSSAFFSLLKAMEGVF